LSWIYVNYDLQEVDIVEVDPDGHLVTLRMLNSRGEVDYRPWGANVVFDTREECIRGSKDVILEDIGAAACWVREYELMMTRLSDMLSGR
jgi:hypothetical protein